MRKWSIIVHAVLFVQAVFFAISSALTDNWLAFWLCVFAGFCFAYIAGLHVVDVIKEGLKK